MTGTSISCYSCNSRNYTHPSCHDPIHPSNTSYLEHCKVPKEDHDGLFPAYYCVKMTGISRVNKEPMIARFCTLESMDNQCGEFKFMGESFDGCILTCTYDGCNHAVVRSPLAALVALCSTAATLLFSLTILSDG